MKNSSARSPNVFNRKRDRVPDGAVSIERPSKWGNPFRIGIDGTRSQVIKQYIEWVNNRPKLIEAIRRELRGKDLVCCCKPKKCHGDYLLLIANQPSIFDK